MYRTVQYQTFCLFLNFCLITNYCFGILNYICNVRMFYSVFGAPDLGIYSNCYSLQLITVILSHLNSLTEPCLYLHSLHIPFILPFHWFLRSVTFHSFPPIPLFSLSIPSISSLTIYQPLSFLPLYHLHFLSSLYIHSVPSNPHSIPLFISFLLLVLPPFLFINSVPCTHDACPVPTLHDKIPQRSGCIQYVFASFEAHMPIMYSTMHSCMGM